MRRRWAGVGLVVLSGVVLGATGVCCVRLKEPTPEYIQRQIPADLPLGTPRPTVEDYLRRRETEFVAVEGEPEDRRGEVRVVDMAGLGDRVAFSMIRATVAPARVDPWWPGEVRVFFFFDLGGCLIGYFFEHLAHAL
jgi:hypothetical protein